VSRLGALLLAAPLALVGCSTQPEDPRELAALGTDALGSGKYDSARIAFDRALAAIGDEADHPERRRATLGAIRARAHLDPPAARDAMVELIGDGGFAPTEGETMAVADELAEERAWTEAMAVVQAGLDARGESAILATRLEQLREDSVDPKKNGEVTDLEDLGYLGGE